LVLQYGPGLSLAHIALYRAPFLPRIQGRQLPQSPSRSTHSTPKMATINLNNIQFYSPPPPPSRPCGIFEPTISTGIPTGNRPMCTPSSTFQALQKTSAQTEIPRHLERPFISPPAPALPGFTVQQQSESPHAAQTNFDRMLEELGVAEIETIDLTHDDSLDSLLSWVSEELCGPPSPSGSFPPFEGRASLFLPASLAVRMSRTDP
jgi:hypothetical protein